MSVINKYYPADFDHRKVSQRRGPRKAGPKLGPVRIMAPFKMQCMKCGEWIGKRRKFNAKKETLDETYLGIQIIRLSSARHARPRS